MFVCVGLQMLYVDKESKSVVVDLLHVIPSTGPLVVLNKLPSVFIGIGVAVVLVSFLGCYGACEESVCFLCMVRDTQRHADGCRDTQRESGADLELQPLFLNLK